MQPQAKWILEQGSEMRPINLVRFMGQGGAQEVINLQEVIKPQGVINTWISAKVLIHGVLWLSFACKSALACSAATLLV